MGQKQSKPKSENYLILVNYEPGKLWHRFYTVMKYKKGFCYIYDDDIENFNRVLKNDSYPNLIFRQVQQTYEQSNRGTELGGLVIDKNIKYDIKFYDEGWVKITDENSFISYGVGIAEKDEDFKFLDSNPSLEEIIKYFDLRNKEAYLILIKSRSLYRQKPFDDFDFKYNENLDLLTNPLTFEPTEYPFHLSHAVPTNSVSNIIKHGKICIDDRCLTNVYHEPTGIFLYNETNFVGGQFPGIYMELFQHSKITPFTLPMELNDKFNHFRYLAVDNFSSIIYGEVGFIYNFEDIFSKYRVSLKKDLKMGHGKDITLDEYVYNFGGECIIRANEISINNIYALYVKFTFTEIDFIHDKLSKNDKTLLDVINLYLTFKRKTDKGLVSPWFVRKSALKSVLDGYDIKSIKSKNLKKLPKIFAMTPGRGFSNGGYVSIYNDPEEDIESDFESFDPNLVSEFNE